MEREKISSEIGTAVKNSAIASERKWQGEILGVQTELQTKLDAFTRDHDGKMKYLQDQQLTLSRIVADGENARATYQRTATARMDQFAADLATLSREQKTNTAISQKAASDAHLGLILDKEMGQKKAGGFKAIFGGEDLLSDERLATIDSHLSAPPSVPPIGNSIGVQGPR
jgi:hypothetical protein